MRLSFLLATVLLVSLPCHAQKILSPEDLSVVSPEDFEREEQKVIETMNWLLTNSIEGNLEEMKIAKRFIYDWVTGSPKFHFNVNPEIVSFLSSSPNLILVYKGGWARYAIENQDFQNNYRGSKAGIEAVISFYKLNKEFLKEDKHVEQLIRLEQEGKLDDLIKKHVKIEEEN